MIKVSRQSLYSLHQGLLKQRSLLLLKNVNLLIKSLSNQSGWKCDILRRGAVVVVAEHLTCALSPLYVYIFMYKWFILVILLVANFNFRHVVNWYMMDLKLQYHAKFKRMQLSLVSFLFPLFLFKLIINLYSVSKPSVWRTSHLNIPFTLNFCNYSYSLVGLNLRSRTIVMAKWSINQSCIKSIQYIPFLYWFWWAAFTKDNSFVNMSIKIHILISYASASTSTYESLNLATIIVLYRLPPARQHCFHAAAIATAT